MNQRVYKTLEFDKIINKLKDLAASEMAKELCRTLEPVCDMNKIRDAQRETADALSRILKHGRLSFSGIKDIRPSLMRLDIGSTLGTGELLSISFLLTVAARAKAYDRNEDASDSESGYRDSLQERFDSVSPLTPLNTEIKRCILSEEQISDDASSELKHIRRTIQNTNNRIHEQLNSMVNSASTKTMLQENIVTMRNGRYCLPVKQEYKSSFAGMMHDQSSSGSTAFIEPMAVVKLNNELRELAILEQEEIEKILANLSNLAAENMDILSENLSLLTELDFIFAKGELAKQMKATEPAFNETGYINIKKGRHPLIDSKKVVPIDLYLGKDFRLLIITGPNTGGKTVSLKTVGLFTLMGQSGMHIPAFDNSELSVFEEVFADIGDEQSIEQNLSTFSSHMVNTISILKEATPRSLALFDELGAGTDPTEGAALAMSILSDLLHRKVTTMATTHYSELKVFALTTGGVENACCEFNVETLCPTYHLLIGIPGKSNAFAISERLGLPEYIIQDAKTRIDSEEQSFEDVISDLEKSRVAIQNEEDEIKRNKEDIVKLKARLQEKNDKIDSTKERILQRANEEARELLQSAKNYADESIKKYNKWMKDGGAGREMEQERSQLREQLNKAEAKLSINMKRKPKKVYAAKDFKVGDAVKVVSLGLDGTVSTLPNDKGDLMVQMGILKSQVNIHDLELMDEPVITARDLQKTGSGLIKISKAMSVRTDINLIGKTVDEAIPLLDKYLDDAYLSQLTQVTVIHGRGTGALRNAVHAHLKKTNYVKTYRIGEFGEGDHGVTIVEFKQ